MQSPGFINEPDYFDAIETVAAAYGADATDMASLYADFAEARYFVGGNDDEASDPTSAETIDVTAVATCLEAAGFVVATESEVDRLVKGVAQIAAAG